MSRKTVCLVGGYRYVNYANWLHKVKLTDNPKRADVLLFAGGEDVDPKLYGQKEGKFTYCNYDRDDFEVKVFKDNLDKFKLGICRGAQLQSVMSGGSLIQHVSGHAGCVHNIVEKDTKRMYRITSLHHQMVLPGEAKHKLIAYSQTPRSVTYLNGDDKEIELEEDFLEPEIVWFPETKSLGVQGHPLE